MELKEGMYVRTKKNGIAKIISKKDVSGSLHKENIVFILDNGNKLALNSKKVLKASNDIIDLIEVGDYVNGYKVLFIDSFFNKGKNVKCINNEEERACFYEEDIKDIITKEKFNACKYVVERDTNENI